MERAKILEITGDAGPKEEFEVTGDTFTRRLITPTGEVKDAISIQCGKEVDAKSLDGRNIKVRCRCYWNHSQYHYSNMDYRWNILCECGVFLPKHLLDEFAMHFPIYEQIKKHLLLCKNSRNLPAPNPNPADIDRYSSKHTVFCQTPVVLKCCDLLSTSYVPSFERTSISITSHTHCLVPTSFQEHLFSHESNVAGDNHPEQPQPVHKTGGWWWLYSYMGENHQWWRNDTGECSHNQLWTKTVYKNVKFPLKTGNKCWSWKWNNRVFEL